MKKLMLFLALCCAASCARAQALPEGEWALVNTSSVFMRAKASYTSENVSQSRMGTPVQILEKSGYWRRIRTPEPYEGWVNELTLAPMPKAYRSSPRYICTADHSHILAAPSAGAAVLCDFSMGDIVMKGSGSCPEGWLKVVLADGREGWVEEGAVCGFKELMNAPHKDFAADLTAVARRFLGSPYMWGGMSSGLFDCSGLVGFCFFMNGIQLPRDASQQVNCGVEVPVEEMQAGDLVFFGESRVAHVALCTGPGRIIHSSQIVRENSLSAGGPDAYTRNILHVRRIIGNWKGTSKVADSPLYFGK